MLEAKAKKQGSYIKLMYGEGTSIYTVSTSCSLHKISKLMEGDGLPPKILLNWVLELGKRFKDKAKSRVKKIAFDLYRPLIARKGQVGKRIFK